MEGTVLGTLIIPYCSGAPNVFFAIAIARSDGPGHEVVVNALVNNVTNMTLLIGLPALLWGLQIMPRKKVAKRAMRGFRLSRLSLSLTLLAMLTFTGVTWALGADRSLSAGDGVALIGMFLFWQLVEVINVLRTNVETGRELRAVLLLDLLGICAGGVVMFGCVEGLVQWVSGLDEGFICYRNVGWLSGWLTVLPNAVPAFYYARRGQADVVYSSQVGDGHICIPFCIGLSALFRPIAVPPLFTLGMLLTICLGLFHLGLVAVRGRARRASGVFLVGVYALFVYYGLFAL